MTQCLLWRPALMGSTTCLEFRLRVSPNPKQFYYAEYITVFVCLIISIVILQYYKLELDEIKSLDEKLRCFL